MQVYDIPIDKNKKETTLHGNYEFPLAIYKTNLRKNVLGFINWHWHDEIQFCLIQKGYVEFHINQDVYTLKAGQGIFVNSGCLHMAKPLSDPNSTYVCLNADVKLISSFPGSIIEQKYIKPLISSNMLYAIPLTETEEWHRSILQSLEKIYLKYLEKELAYEIDITIELFSIWRLIIDNINFNDFELDAKVNVDYERMKVILSYIENNYMDKIILQEIADLIHFSRSECCRLFKRSANCTLFDYIMDYRINKSIEFLLKTDMPVT